jgi:hypothetical protein
VKSLSHVLVEAAFSLEDNVRFEKVNMVVRSISKHKKQAYVDLMKKYHGVVRTLVKLRVIPNKAAMVRSIIHCKQSDSSKRSDRPRKEAPPTRPSQRTPQWRTPNSPRISHRVGLIKSRD